MITNIGIAPKHTFGEAVIVNGKTFNFNTGHIYYKPCEPDEFYLPFKHSCGSTFTAIGQLPATLASMRKAVVNYAKHLDSIGTVWDRRKP